MFLFAQRVAVAMLITIALGGRAASGAEPCNWPRFEGPDGRNISADTGLLNSWPEGGPKLALKIAGLGEGFSSVAIVNGALYTAGDIGGKEVVSAFATADGRKLWSREIGDTWTKPHTGSRSTPTFNDGRLYCLSPMGDIACLDAKSGDKIWGFNVLKRFNAKNVDWGLAESLVVDGQQVFVSPFSAETSIAALNKDTGDVLWKAPAAGGVPGYTTPTLGNIGPLRVLVTLSGQAAVGVNAANGALLFTHPHKTQFDVIATTPILRNDELFITSGYRAGSEMLRLKADGEKLTVEPLWKNTDLDNQFDGVILLDGHVYGFSQQSRNGRMICVDWATGATAWAEKASGKSTLTFADGHFYLLNEKREVSLARATPEKLEIVSHFSLPEGGQGVTWARPVVCGGRLYLRHGDFLYVYDVAAR